MEAAQSIPSDDACVFWQSNVWKLPICSICDKHRVQGLSNSACVVSVAHGDRDAGARVHVSMISPRFRGIFGAKADANVKVYNRISVCKKSF